MKIKINAIIRYPVVRSSQKGHSFPGKEKVRAFEVDMLEVAEADLQPAFIVNAHGIRDRHRNNYDGTFYFYNDELYIPYRLDARLFFALNDSAKSKTTLENFREVALHPGMNHLLAPVWGFDRDFSSIANAKARWQRLLDGEMITSGGEIYLRFIEPCYFVCRAGGKFTLGVTVNNPKGSQRDLNEDVFCALDYDKAVEKAIEESSRLGWPASKESIPNPITVLLPDAVKMPRRISQPIPAIEKALSSGKRVRLLWWEEETFAYRRSIDISAVRSSILRTKDGKPVAVFTIDQMQCNLQFPVTEDGQFCADYFGTENDRGVMIYCPKSPWSVRANKTAN